MDSVWFMDDSQSARRQIWFAHIGAGLNIRTADLPLLLTKRMAHVFPQAPSHYLADEALRWAQVLGQGGDTDLADAINATRLGAVSPRRSSGVRSSTSSADITCWIPPVSAAS